MDKQGMEMEKKLSYEVQIKEGDAHGHSSTQHCAGILGYWDFRMLGF